MAPLHSPGLNYIRFSVPASGDAAFPSAVPFTVQQTIRFDPLVVKAILTLLPPIRDIRVLPHPEWEVTVTANGDTQREITATPVRPGVTRTVNDPLQIVPMAEDGDRPIRQLPILGAVKPDVVGSPEAISLGRVRLGVVEEESVRLLSLSGRAFEVVSVEGKHQTCESNMIRPTHAPSSAAFG